MAQYNRMKSVLFLLATVGFVLAVLEYLIDARIVTSSFAEAPSDVFLAMPAALTASFMPIVETLAEVAASFSLAMLIGVALGLSLGGVPTAYKASSGILTALYSIPKITILPAMILWVGLGPSAVVSFATLEACIPMTLILASAVRDFDPRLILVGKALGATPFQIQRMVVIPGLRSQLLASIQIGLVFSFLGVILAQMFLGFGGVGSLLLNDAYQLRIAQLYAISTIFALLVVAFLSITRLVLDRFGAKVQVLTLTQRV